MGTKEFQVEGLVQPERLLTWEELNGKTIARTVSLPDGRKAFVFTDGSVMVLGIDRGYETGDEEFDIEDEPLALYDFLRLGLIDEVEYQRRMVLSNMNAAESQERIEREMYEQLKRKFEP